jgi:hypothetical protein
MQGTEVCRADEPMPSPLPLKVIAAQDHSFNFKLYIAITHFSSTINTGTWRSGNIGHSLLNSSRLLSSCIRCFLPLFYLWHLSLLTKIEVAFSTVLLPWIE